jgi:hypothetical protein
MLIVGLGASACGAAAPTAPSPMPLSLGAGHYTLLIFGTAACTSIDGGNGPSAVSVGVTLEPGDEGKWRLSSEGQTLSGEVELVDSAVEGYVRGSASTASVRITTGDMPDSTVAFEGAASVDHYEGTVLVGTPRFEGTGAASGSVTTCASNGFSLKRS